MEDQKLSRSSDDIRVCLNPALTDEDKRRADGAILLDFDPLEVGDLAVVGVVQDAAGDWVHVYDVDTLVFNLAGTYSEEGILEGSPEAVELALEWVEFNTLRAVPYMGAGAPLFVVEYFGGAEDEGDVLELLGKRWIYYGAGCALT